MMLQQHYGLPRSILGPSSLKNRFRALKPSAFERELNFKKSYMIFGDLEPSNPLRGSLGHLNMSPTENESKPFLYLATKYWYFKPAWPFKPGWFFRELLKVDTSYHQVATASKLSAPDCIQFDHSPPDFITFAGYSYKCLLKQPPSGNYLHYYNLHNSGLNVCSKPAQAMSG